MRWDFCQDCHIDGCCENQDRGNKCEVYAKKITEECESLEIQLGIVIEILLRECPQYEGYVRANFPNYKRS